MNLRLLSLCLALVGCVGAVALLVGKSRATSGFLIQFQTSDAEPVELWIGPHPLGKTPLEISSDNLKQVILKEFPASDCARSTDLGFVSNDRNGGTKFQFFYDGEPHIKFLRNQQEVPMKAGYYKHSESNQIKITLTAARAPQTP